MIKPHEEMENNIYRSWIIGKQEDLSIRALLDNIDNHGTDHLLAFDYKKNIQVDGKPLWQDFHTAYQTFYQTSLDTKLYDIEVKQDDVK